MTDTMDGIRAIEGRLTPVGVGQGREGIGIMKGIKDLPEFSLPREKLGELGERYSIFRHNSSKGGSGET